jgi:cell division protein FtsI (penicillin-binding protein 3)
VLRGDTSNTLILRDGLGRPLESPAAKAPGALGGDTVILTVNRALQEICERSLDDAVTRMDATGGDIVVLDPQDGDILALASQRRGIVGPASTTLTEPFEPGSTIKPFIAAPLIARGRVSPGDVVDTHAGRLVLHGRTLTDTHRAPAMTLREVIRWSSNVGIAQFAQRLTRREEYEALRDVGFGSATGLPFPGEAAGTLRDPTQWSKQSPASLAIGYEVAVTPLQLALAYASIANGGELLEPGLVREIRGADGTVRYRRERRVVRRVMPREVAEQLRDILVETVANGTAAEADLPSYIVAGKTGTARRTEYGAGYGRNEYTASFVGLFPGRDPQYVILVKLDNPTTSYYGGKTAAPVFKTVLEAALAARDPALDRGALAAGRRASAAEGLPLATPDTVAADIVMPGDTARESMVTVPVGGPVPVSGVRRPPTTAVPDVRGLSVRAAVRALHGAGLRVELMAGPPGTTDPAAGTTIHTGAVVRLGDGS